MNDTVYGTKAVIPDYRQVLQGTAISTALEVDRMSSTRAITSDSIRQLQVESMEVEAVKGQDLEGIAMVNRIGIIQECRQGRR